MDGGSIESALDRIESALARLERGVTRPLPEEPGLRERHEALKASVSQALEELDALIARQRG